MPRIEFEGPAAPALPDRHPFTSTFLVLFLLDALVGLAIGIALLLGRMDPEKFSDILIPFSLALLMGSLIQTSLSFRHGMRWSARLIGLFVLAFWLLDSAFQIAAQAVLFATQGVEALEAGERLLSSGMEGAITVAINILQILLGIWAVRDLRQSHYIQPH